MSLTLKSIRTEAGTRMMLGAAGLAAVAIGLVLWRRRVLPAGEQSEADEVEAHPS